MHLYIIYVCMHVYMYATFYEKTYAQLHGASFYFSVQSLVPIQMRLAPTNSKAPETCAANG